jgi:type II secretory pathway pseudopilin PulG
MKRENAFTRRPAGYTIIEAMVAVSLLMLAIGAAAALSMSLVNQEEINARAARALNWQENAARLFQLGMGTPTDVSDIVDVMPGLPGMANNGFTASTAAQTFAALPTGNDQINVTTLSLVYISDTAGNVSRTSSMVAVR